MKGRGFSRAVNAARTIGGFSRRFTMISIKTAAVRDHSAARVAGAAVLVSLFSFLYYLQRSDLLLYGDAVAHINIARRVFDSQTPGLLQLGTVWLPLPHLLMIPFIWSDTMWQSGAGGSIPSMIAYVLGVVGIFRLMRGMLETDVRTKPAAGVGAWAAAFAYGANPNLIYMQATAMTESVYLALFVWEFASNIPRTRRNIPTIPSTYAIIEGIEPPAPFCHIASQTINGIISR